MSRFDPHIFPYDPILARFMSADPFVQFEYNSQSYNRYSYVLNNPLGATDPSGYMGEDANCDCIDTGDGGKVRDKNGNGIFSRSDYENNDTSKGLKEGRSNVIGSGGGTSASMGADLGPWELGEILASTVPNYPGGYPTGGYYPLPFPYSLPWGTDEFLFHYAFGGGRGVALTEIGLAGLFEEHPQTEFIVKAAIHNAKVYIGSNGKIGALEDTLSYSNIGGRKAIDVINPLYSLGTGPVEYQSTCSGGSCTTVFEVNDIFTDPLDFEDMAGVRRRIDVVGEPYPITHTFTRTFTY